MSELKTRSYDREYRFHGIMLTDQVTEYEYISNKNLTKEEFTEILKSAGAYLFGEIKYIKKQLIFKTGLVQFKHLCEVIMY